MRLKKNGYAALLGLLIVIAIGMMIYFLDIKAMFGASQKYISRPARPADHPWQMEDLLVPADQIVASPKKGQPELLEPVALNASVQRNNSPRGYVKITFGKDCRINAEWLTQYESEKKSYSLKAQMNGNVVPSEIYIDANNQKDKTHLFFIAKGPYIQITRTADNLSQSEEGTAYVLGWLHPDNTAEGTITITTDQTWSAIYPFSCNKALAN